MVFVECGHCGQEYDIKPSKAESSSYCSRECHTASQRNQVQLDCKHCEDEYEVKASKATSSEFCSRECKDAWKRQGQNTHVTRACENCGDRVKRTPYNAKRADKHFCNSRCRGAWISRNQREENNPNWKPDATHEFGDNWKALREQVIDRDVVCQYCGADGKNSLLDVHHIVPRCAFDPIERANTLLNLVLLCRSCHKQAEHGNIVCPIPALE
ncbi:HNH endonuclease [Halostella salina]|uniref:HNH endonuclease n=1 Tax=Halostella salina TaxID=1547897 RepID=UPI000EF84C9A